MGFGLVTFLSLFPWSRFGDDSGFLGAWAGHWSLVAVAGSALGLLSAFHAWMRPGSGRAEALAYAVLAVVVAGAAILHHLHPPPLSDPSPVPLLSLPGAGAALLGAAMKATAVWARGPAD